MNNPALAVETPSLASEERLAGWVARFSSYRKGPTREVLLEWLQRFSPDHLQLAHKLLDAVIIVSEYDIHEGYKEGLSAIPGWSRARDERAGRWYFVGVGSAGESGPAMLRMFREANGMTAEAWQSFFVTVRDLPRLGLTALDHVIFVDDFAGSGKQIVDYWPVMEELVASEAACYLLLTAVTEDAAKKIAEETELKLFSRISLPKSANLFADECEIFDADERAALDIYSKKASSQNPRGFGKCGLALVLSHKTPNNTLPIFHANNSRWVGPFPRNLIRAA